MGLIGSLLGLCEEPEKYCKSCWKCACYAARCKKACYWDVTYFRMPDYERLASMCYYNPDGFGGCRSFQNRVGFRSFFIDAIRDQVKPKPGSVVVCDLKLFILPGVDHSGIADGKGMIIHRDGDAGLMRSTPSSFMDRLNGKNGALCVFVACSGHSPIGNQKALERAEKALYDPAFGGYDLFRNNCHQFVQYCLTGKRDNSFTFASLENHLCQHHDLDNWRVWDIDDML